MPKTPQRAMAIDRTTNSLTDLLQECRATDHDRSLAVAMPPVVRAIEAAAQHGEPLPAILKGTSILSVGVAAAVPNHLRAEKAARLRELALEAPSQGVTITDPIQPGNPIVYANAGFLRLTGYELDEVTGTSYTYLVGCDTDAVSRAQISEAIHAGQSQTIVLSNHRKDGTSFWDEVSISSRFDSDGKVTNIVGVHNDVTQRKQLEKLHWQSHKFEAIGQFANGITHDFNNLLTVILAYTELLLHSRACDGPTHDSLVQVSKAAEQAACLTRQLQVISTSQPACPVLISWNSIIRGMENLLRRALGADVEVSTSLQPDLHRVLGDPAQLSQVLLDLAVYARNAMPCGGMLKVETRNVSSAGDAAAMCGALSGDFVMLSIVDLGTLGSCETMYRDFETEIASSRPRAGDSSALIEVQRMVTQSKGHMDVEAIEGESGGGTRIKLYFPRAESTANKRTPLSIHSKFPRGREQVLLVEDETSVRELCRKVLEKCGYTVLEAHDSDSAVQAAKNCPAPIHLLVIDVVLPGAGGRSLTRQLQAIHPKSRTLFMSGRWDENAIRHGTQREQIEFLAKPFTPIALARKVRDALDRCQQVSPGGVA